MASQSGAVAITILDHATRTGVGLSSFVSLGNKADVSGNDLLSYRYDHLATRAVALYPESVGNPRRFARIARAIGRRKPVLAVEAAVPRPSPEQARHMADPRQQRRDELNVAEDGQILDGSLEVVMKALVYHGPGVKGWEDVARPELSTDTDAIVRVDTTTICGTDLHILKGDVPAMIDGRVIGHEAVGTVAQVGAAVKNVTVGDRVLVSCVSACGGCRFCREGRYGQCTGGGGWILGNEIDGTQAEYVRVPFADTSTYPVPDGVSDEELLMLADILPTGFEVGVLNGRVQPGDVVAVVGAGPVGLSAISGARLFSPSLVVAIDVAPARLEAAKQFGADVMVNNAEQDPIAAVRELTAGLGADVAIEAVGVPATFELAADLVRPVGRVANIGVHGKPVTLHLERLWARDVTITTGLVDTYSTPTLLRLLTSHQIDAQRFVTHRFGFDDFIRAYDVFSRAGETGALKVVLSHG